MMISFVISILTTIEKFMKQLDLFAEAGICRAAPDGVHIVVDSPKIYESPDKGKTVYQREFGESERTLVKTAVQQQWTISYKATP